MSTERRGIRRFNAALDVEIQGIHLSTNNISICGAQVSCPAMHLDFLSADLASGVLAATVMLPGGNRVRCVCATQYVTDYGSEYLIGLKFTSFEENGEQLLAEYLTEHAGPDFIPHGRLPGQQ